MNTKAEKFKAYIDKVDPKAFTMDELKDDELHSVVFRSGIEVKGQRLPFLVLIDDSVYVMLRVFVAIQAVNDANKAAVYDFLNQSNKQYKVFKFYTSDNGDIVLDICLPAGDDAFDPQLIDMMIRQVAYPYLNDNLPYAFSKNFDYPSSGYEKKDNVYDEPHYNKHSSDHYSLAKYLDDLEYYADNDMGFTDMTQDEIDDFFTDIQDD